MNVNTGELIAVGNGEELKELMKAWGDDLRQVPPELQGEANKALNGNSRTFIDLKADTPLANFAKKERSKNKKAKRKMAQASRKRNR